MQALFRFIENYQILFYLLAAMAGLYSLRRLSQVWREWRAAYFGLEREVSLRKLAQAVAFLVAALIFACGVAFISVFVVPGLPASARVSEADLLAASASPLTGAASLDISTPAAPSADRDSQGCVARQLEIASPEPGAEIGGPLKLIGTVDLPNLGFYKYEVARQGSDLWSTIAAGNQAVVNDELGNFNPTVLTPGDYSLRIVALDNAAQVIGICVIPIRIKGQ